MKKLTLMTALAISLFACKKEQLGQDEPINVPTEDVITGNITSTTTLTSDRNWILKGYVYVTNGASLIIQPGTVIKSDISEKGAICIERGSKIIADGTSDKPIVFTSGKPVGERLPGDWGGIVILGNARTNRVSEPTIEGGIGRPYGGNDDNDNSGVLRYVRIEYAGIAALPNSEINALTLGAVGSGTIIEYVQTIYANDDAFEFFGGTVSPKYLYTYATADDDFDFDFGYTGSLSYSVSKRDPLFVDSGDKGNGVECDNDGTGSTATPTTHPKLNYLTLIGPNSLSALSNHHLGLRWRRSTNFTIENSNIIGFKEGGFSIESPITAQSYVDGISNFKNNKVGVMDPTKNFISNAPTIITSEGIKIKALLEGNIEVIFTDLEIMNLTKPTWSEGWTRFPTKGD